MSSSNCLCCGRAPSAQRPVVKCINCIEAFYCSNDCREAHKSEHEKNCKGAAETTSNVGANTTAKTTATKKTKPQRPKEELLKPIQKKEGLPDISLQELADCKTSGDEKLWIGCKGRIFDVSGSEFYGSGGSYSSFVGKDTSVALGKMKFNSEFFDPSVMHWARDLDQRELNILQDWTDKFEVKYEVVGYIKDDGVVV